MGLVTEKLVGPVAEVGLGIQGYGQGRPAGREFRALEIPSQGTSIVGKKTEGGWGVQGHCVESVERKLPQERSQV